MKLKKRIIVVLAIGMMIGVTACEKKDESPDLIEMPTATQIVTKTPTEIPTEISTPTSIATEVPTTTPAVTEALTETPTATEVPTATSTITDVITTTVVPIPTAVEEETPSGEDTKTEEDKELENVIDQVYAGLEAQITEGFYAEMGDGILWFLGMNDASNVAVLFRTNEVWGELFAGKAVATEVEDGIIDLILTDDYTSSIYGVTMRRKEDGNLELYTETIGEKFPAAKMDLDEFLATLQEYMATYPPNNYKNKNDD